MTLAGLGIGAPAHAAPVVTGGLVNVTLVDVLDVNGNQVIVAVPVSVAAAVCDVNVAVLALLDDAPSACSATSEAVADATQQRTRRN